MHVDRWRIISLYLDRVLELPAAERAAWLAELATREPEVADEVSQLLAVRGERDFDSFLSDSPAAAAMEGMSKGGAGKRVGAYILEREIGRGGMGTVWLASRGDGHYEGQVAVKLLGGAWLGEDAIRRFRREATLLARLDHPNIARLIDAGITDFGQPYLVLEYIEGANIDTYCNSRQLDIPARLRLFANVLDAVSYAHRQLIVHRDIKPSNIFVATDGTVKLLDFGIAQLITPDELTNPPTRGVSMALTPEYAAPEQLLGKPVTTATDTYALGLTLYVLLAGRHPFPDNAGSAAAAVQSVNTDAKRASELAQSAQAAHELRGDLDNILCKAVRKSPEDRYATVNAFAMDLQRYLAHQPVMAGPDTVRYRVGKFIRRHRGAVGAGVLTALTLIAATLITSLQMIEARRQRDEARFQTRRAEAANEFMNVLLISESPAAAPVTGRERLELGVRIVERQYRDDPKFAGRMLIQFGRQFRGLNETRRAVELFTAAYDLGRRNNDPELMARAQCTAAYAEATGHNAEHAAARLEAANRILREINRPDVGLRVDCLQAEGMLATRTGEFERGEQRFGEARALLEKAHETHRSAYVSVLNDLGGLYAQTNQRQKSYAMTHLAGTIHERYGRGGTSARLTILSNEGVELLAMGEAQTAWQIREKIERRLAVIELDRQRSMAFLVNRANLLARLEKPQVALETLGDAVERSRRAQNNYWVLSSLRVMASCHLQLRKLDLAQAEVDEGLELAKAGKANLNFRVQFEMLGISIQMRRGEWENARRRLEAVLSAVGYPQNKSVGYLQSLLSRGAEIALHTGQPVEAERRARQSLEIAESVARGADTSGDVGEALLLLAKARTAQGRSNEAKPLLERAMRCLTNGFGAEHSLTREARQLLGS